MKSLRNLLLFTLVLLLAACAAPPPSISSSTTASAPTAAPTSSGMSAMGADSGKETQAYASLVGGIYNGGDLFFIHTEASDPDVAAMLTDTPRILNSVADVEAAQAAGEITVTQPGIVVNMSVLVWPGGAR